MSICKIDVVSGATTEREGLDGAVRFARPGDTLVLLRSPTAAPIADGNNVVARISHHRRALKPIW